MTQPQGAPQRRIVVGVDGSESLEGRAGLGDAAGRADPRGGGRGHGLGVPQHLRPGVARRCGLPEHRRPSRRGHHHRDVRLPHADGIRPHVVMANAVRALLDASAGAELLVVGNRGHGGFVGALLGSVSQHCLHQATCPVVVVRGAQRPSAP
jgi:nucleotide-binding universal stress UspA family protein